MRKFQIEQLRNIVWDDDDEFEVVEEKEVGTSRWANEYEAVFREKSTGKLYGMGYRRGTGDEGERPFEHDDKTSFEECPEMEAVQVIATEYRQIKIAPSAPAIAVPKA